MKAWLTPFQQQFTQLILQQRLPHALIFHGMSGAGKQELSDWLVKLLLCQQPQMNDQASACGQCKSCLLFNSHSYPDHKVLRSEKTTIGVDDIRTTNSFLEKTAFFGTEKRSSVNSANTEFIKQAKKTVVIEHAEQMTVAAANALLKTLEEPSDNSLIILLTAELDSLLPTIISRCRVVSIRPPVGDKLNADNQFLSIEPFANISQLPELTDEKINQAYNDFSQKILHYLHTQNNFTDVANALVQDPHCFRWFEKIIVNSIRGQYHWQVSDTKVLAADSQWWAQLDKEKIWQLYQLILTTSKQIKLLNQVNKPFVIEKLLINSANLLQVSYS